DLLTVLDLLEAELGRPIERRHVDNRVGDVPHSQADGARLLSAFPDIEPTPLVTGLAATVAWMRTLG
ncbi:MAG: GDP-mannose 4,6-dehydratase, partial [Desertimonas sp.]